MSWSRKHSLGASVLLLILFAMIGGGLFLGPLNWADTYGDVALSLRLNRALAGAIGGSALAIAGVLMQALFRNPLAEPGIMGTGSGAMLGGLGAMALATVFPVSGHMMVPIGCLLGALLSLILVLGLAGRTRSETGTLLAGVVVGMFLTAIATLVLSLFQDQWNLGRSMLGFTLGSLDGRGALHLTMAAPLLITGTVAAWWWGRRCDLLLGGVEEAESLGVDTRQARRWLVMWSGVLVAAAAIVGAQVAFVGLVVPHACRLLVGPSHRGLVPLAALGGAIAVIACDLLIRALSVMDLTDSELPLGVVTSLVGAPVFILLLRKRMSERLP